MAKIRGSHIQKDVDGRGKTLKVYTDFVASDKYKLRKELLAEISRNDAKSLYDKLIGRYDTPVSWDYPVLIASHLYRRQVDFDMRPVIEKFYIEEPDIFHELVDRIVEQNNADLCEALLKALEHISVTDINLKKLYAFDAVRIEKAINDLNTYSESLEDWSPKKNVLSNLHSQLKKELAVCYQPKKEEKDKKESTYPSLPDEGNSQENILIAKVKKMSCKLHMYKILHKQDAILEKHYDPKLVRIIGDIILALAFGFTLNCLNKSLTGNWGFFNQETTSMQCVKGVDKALFKEDRSSETMVGLTSYGVIRKV